MCGIVGAVAQRDIADILVEGLRRLEYRGYDSAGVAIISPQGELQRVRRLGKVQELASALDAQPLAGGIGIAHTRWATHGGVTDAEYAALLADHAYVEAAGTSDPLTRGFVARFTSFWSGVDGKKSAPTCSLTVFSCAIAAGR